MDILGAAKQGNVNLINELISMGIDVNKEDKNGKTALYYACDLNNLVIVNNLLKARCKCDIATKGGWTPLSVAAHKGHTEIVQALINAIIEYNFDLRILDSDLPLYRAVNKNHIEIVKILIEKGCNKDLQYELNQNITPIMLAAKQGRSEMVKFLLESGCSLNITDQTGKTALFHAVQNGHERIVKIILESLTHHNDDSSILGKLIDGGETDENKPLYAAVRENRFDIVSLLLNAGCDIRVCKSNRDIQMKLLQFMIENDFKVSDGMIDEVDNHIEKNKLREIQKYHGKFPIHIALRWMRSNDDSSVVQDLSELIKKYDDSVCDVDYFGLTPYLLAKSNNAPTNILVDLLNRSYQHSRKVIKKNASNYPLNVKIKKYVTTTQSFRSSIRITHPAKVYFECVISCIGDSDLAVFHELCVGVIPHSWTTCSRNYFKNLTSVGKVVCNEAPNRKSGTVVGVLIDMSEGRIQFSFDGIISEEYSLPISIESSGNAVSPIFVINCNNFMSDSIPEVSFNFGQISSADLLYKPLYYQSVFEHAGNLFPYYLEHLMEPVNNMNWNWDIIKPESGMLSKYYFDWSDALRSGNNAVVNKEFLEANANNIGELAEAMDERGRIVFYNTFDKTRSDWESLLYFMGRFKFYSKDSKVHTSTSCEVFKAMDSINGSEVAIKFMRNQEDFLQEIECRKFHLSNLETNKCVIDILDSFRIDGDNPLDVKFRMEMGKSVKKVDDNMRYGIIMPAASNDLEDILKKDASLHMKTGEISNIVKGIVDCIDKMHKEDVIHGDIKPRNIMHLVDGLNVSLILIDLDSATKFNNCIGRKYSSAYCPPEMIYYDCKKSIYCVKESPVVDGAYKNELAKPSIDIWALGVVLYRMCTRENLFKINESNDNITDQQELQTLCEWTDDTIRDKLSKDKVTNDHARHLLSQILRKDASTRLHLNGILKHHFITGKQTIARLMGTAEPSYDVFISYRVWCDADYVKRLYNILTKDKKLNVFWDREELKMGENWREGFVNGLADSKVFICIITENAVKSFAELKEDSECDNVLLEHQLALELIEQKFLKKACPVFIGEANEGSISKFEVKKSSYNSSQLPELSVHNNADELSKHLERLNLAPWQPYRSVKDTAAGIQLQQGQYISGKDAAEIDDCFEVIASEVCKMVKEAGSDYLSHSNNSMNGISSPKGSMSRLIEGIRASSSLERTEISHCIEKLELRVKFLKELLISRDIPIPEDFP